MCVKNDKVFNQAIKFITRVDIKDCDCGLRYGANTRDGDRAIHVNRSVELMNKSQKKNEPER